MQRKSLSLKRIALGIAIYVTGLTLLIVIPHPLYFQAPINILFPSLAIIYFCVFLILFGSLIFGTGFGTRFPLKAFLIALTGFGAWTFFVVLPITILPLPEEVSVLSVSFSLLLLVLLIGWYEKRKRQKHGKGVGMEGKSLINKKVSIKKRRYRGITLIVIGATILIINPFTDLLLFTLIGLLSASLIMIGIHIIGTQ
ncbi:MAG: hypothetical protein QXI91_05375 [Candidatus Bathyarchaeia archaeon]